MRILPAKKQADVAGPATRPSGILPGVSEAHVNASAGERLVRIQSGSARTNSTCSRQDAGRTGFRREGIVLLFVVLLVFASLPAFAAAPGIVIDKPVPKGQHLHAWRVIDDLRWSVAQFDNVFWDPRDTPSLRGQIRTNNIARGKKVFEIGVGTGLLSLCALSQGATRVVGTDINPAAAACAKYNAERFGWKDKFDCRLVSKTNAGAFAVIGKNERFDLIISNPPWVDRKPGNDFEYALYDPGFKLLETLLKGLPDHLNPGGRVFLAYGSVSSIITLRKLAKELGYAVRVVEDKRKVEDLPEEFLPGMTLEVIVPAEKLTKPSKK